MTLPYNVTMHSMINYLKDDLEYRTNPPFGVDYQEIVLYCKTLLELITQVCPNIKNIDGLSRRNDWYND